MIRVLFTTIQILVAVRRLYTSPSTTNTLHSILVPALLTKLLPQRAVLQAVGILQQGQPKLCGVFSLPTLLYTQIVNEL